MSCICRFSNGNRCSENASYPDNNPTVCEIPKHKLKYLNKVIEMHGGAKWDEITKFEEAKGFFNINILGNKIGSKKDRKALKIGLVWVGKDLLEQRSNIIGQVTEHYNKEYKLNQIGKITDEEMKDIVISGGQTVQSLILNKYQEYINALVDRTKDLFSDDEMKKAKSRDVDIGDPDINVTTIITEILKKVDDDPALTATLERVNEIINDDTGNIKKGILDDLVNPPTPKYSILVSDSNIAVSYGEGKDKVEFKNVRDMITRMNRGKYIEPVSKNTLENSIDWVDEKDGKKSASRKSAMFVALFLAVKQCPKALRVIKKDRATRKSEDENIDKIMDVVIKAVEDNVTFDSAKYNVIDATIDNTDQCK
jgi:hypothetical protein